MATPMREQYLKLKRQYPGVILLFRLGDFYETFDEDAQIVSSICEITLTSRPVGNDERVPLAGVPYHSVENYIAKLLKAGYKVAISEQSDNGNRTLMQREVVRIVTPGTITEDLLLSPKNNNYLLAVVYGENQASLAYVDISTAELQCEEVSGDNVKIRESVAALQPAECLYIQGDKEAEQLTAYLSLPKTAVEPWRVSPSRAAETLRQQFNVSTLSSFGIEGKTELIQALALCLYYLQETQPAALSALSSLHYIRTDSRMRLDPNVQRTLELWQSNRSGSTDTSLLAVLDRTMTAMGARLLRERLANPLLDVAAINERLSGLQSFYSDDSLRAKCREVLKRMPDLERLSTKLLQGTVSPRHMLAIAAAIGQAQVLRGLLINNNVRLEGEALVAENLESCPDAKALIEQAISPDAPAILNTCGIIRAGYHHELDEVVALATNVQQILADMESQERERTGIKNLRIGHNSVFGFYLEVPRSQADKVPADYIRKQTLANAERYFTEPLKNLESRVYNAQDRRLALEKEIWNSVVGAVAQQANKLLATSRAVAILDVLSALAEVARLQNYIRPILDNDDHIEIKAGRHPVVEQHLLQAGKSFVPNDVHLSNGEEAILVITGPNMAGKSTYLRQVALIVIMAQMGSFVPAESALISLVDRIFTRIGAQDELASGQSTFMVEMVETASVLRQATPRSLVILDEVGRGTSTYDGMAIARAVVEYIHNSPQLGCKTLFATHYHELIDLEEYLPRVRNYNVTVAEEEDGVVFLHRIARGGADRSYGVHVAHLAGIPQVVLTRAAVLLEQLEAQKQQPTAPPKDTPAARQLALFSSPAEALARELSNIPVEQLTPLEALNTLATIRQRAQKLAKPSRKHQG